MISLYELSIILTGHFIADFMFQNSWMAKNKSTNNLNLLVHVSVYSFVLFVLVALFIDNISRQDVLKFALVSGALHFSVDYFTSKITSWQYKNGHMGTNRLPNVGFFTTIGFDQLLHTIMLFYVYIHLTQGN